VKGVGRILFGLERLPRSIGVDDARLPGAVVGAGLLRLHSEPLPAVVMPDGVGDRAACVAAAVAWLVSLCGDYARPRQRFIESYFGFLAAELDRHRAALATELVRYDGLYAPDDWLWSAPRPLPRAWVPGPEGLLPAEIAFWDGGQPLAIELSARDTPRLIALQAAGVKVLRIAPEALGDPAALGALLPKWFHAFWRGQTLPASPFRRAIPRGVLGPATA
jgi:hypothetical protein